MYRCYDPIFINEHGNQYQVNLLDKNGKKAFIIFKKTSEDGEFKTFFYPDGNEYDSEQEAYLKAQELIKEDYK